jgi:hypothetical protein
MAACFVGCVALSNWLFHEHHSLSFAAVTGLVAAIGAELLFYAERRGWIKGVFWNREKLERRMKHLAADRERILSEAQKKLGA